jgi:uncharacterized membrane protein
MLLKVNDLIQKSLNFVSILLIEVSGILSGKINFSFIDLKDSLWNLFLLSEYILKGLIWRKFCEELSLNNEPLLVELKSKK